MKLLFPRHAPRALFVLCSSTAAVSCLFLAGCSSFKDVRDLRTIQNTPGFYPKALFYCGSDDMAHHFEQETPLGDLTLVSKSVSTFIVDRKALTIPDGAEFSREAYTGRRDERRRLMVIRTDSPQARRGWAEYSDDYDGA